jgi:hypothetical protein
MKREYSSFIRLSGKEFFLHPKGIDVKGFNSDIVDIHRNFMISLIEGAMTVSERLKPVDLVKYLQELRKDYLNKDLEVGYYRELNAESLYRISSNGRHVFGSKTEVDVQWIDPWYNYSNYIIEMISMMI